MKRVIINIKDAVEILDGFKELLSVYREAVEEDIKAVNGESFWVSFYNAGYDIDVSYIGENNEGYMTISKKHNKIKYIIRIDFVYINNKVILEVI